MPKHKPLPWGEWSDWALDESYMQYYRVRQNAQGQVDYEWGQSSAQNVPQGENVPRSTGEGVEAITRGINKLSHATDEIGDQNLYTTAPDFRGQASAFEIREEHTDHRSFQDQAPTFESGSKTSDHKFKDKAKRKSSRPRSGKTYYDNANYNTGHGYSNPAAPTKPYDDGTLDSENAGHLYYACDAYSYGDKIAESSTPRYGAASTLTASGRSPYASSISNQYGSAISHSYNTTHGQPSAADGAAYDGLNERDDVGPLPIHSEMNLPSYYIVEPSRKFKAGEIFKVLWSEPKGSHPFLSGVQSRRNTIGELIHTGFRRFIVIANDQGHCVCVPILTYESRACTKRGIKAHKHGIIHDVRSDPQRLRGEPELGFRPVRAIMTVETETLAKESRVNYSKPSTVEHNLRVWFLGRIHPEDLSIVQRAYQRCGAVRRSSD